MTPTFWAAQFFSRLASWFMASRARRGVVMAAIAKCGSGEERRFSVSRSELAYTHNEVVRIGRDEASNDREPPTVPIG